MTRRIIYTKVVEIVDEKPIRPKVVHHNHHHHPKPVKRLPEPLKIIGADPTPFWVYPLVGFMLIFGLCLIGKLLGFK